MTIKSVEGVSYQIQTLDVSRPFLCHLHFIKLLELTMGMMTMGMMMMMMMMMMTVTMKEEATC